MKCKLLILLASAALLPAVLVPAQAATYTLPEYSGAFHGSNESYPLSPVVIGTFNYTIPDGEVISSATLSGAFGNSSINSTALTEVFLAPAEPGTTGIIVASCTSFLSPCYNNDSFAPPVPWGVALRGTNLSMFNGGSVVLSASQLSPFAIQLGPTTLTLTFASASAPEPGSFGLLGAALTSTLILIRRKK